MVNNYTSIKQKIRQVADLKGISYQSMYKIIEMTDGSFKGSAIKRPINSDALVKLYTKFPDINLEWLLTGKGAMICEPAQKPAIIEDLEKELQGLKDKYYKLMEENHDLLVELRALESKNSKPQKAS